MDSTPEIQIRMFMTKLLAVVAGIAVLSFTPLCEARSTEQIQKLIARKLKWESAQKCVKSMMVENGRVKDLCENHQNIYKLASSIGTKPVSIMIASTLNIISTQESQLQEDLISELPVDKPYIQEAILESSRDTLSLKRPLINAIQSTVQSCRNSPYNSRCEVVINEAVETVRGFERKQELVKKGLEVYAASYNQKP